MSQTTKKYILPYDPTDPEVISAVNTLKERIANAATVHPPNWDLPFHCFSDGAQSAGVGGCICQFIVTGPPRDALSPTPEVEETRRHRKGKYNELDKVTGLDKPNRRLPSQQCPPPEPTDPITGQRLTGYYAPIAFYSKSLKKHHRRWTSMMDVELYGVVCLYRAFEPYLLGSKSVLHTDCEALRYMDKQQQMYGRIARWAAYLSIFEMAVVHCAGIANAVAEYTIRYPLPDPHRPDDGERLKEKGLTNEAGDIQFTERNVPPQWLDNSADEAWVEAAEAVLHDAHKPLTAYLVFTGIGSSMQATEKLRLPLKFIGYTAKWTRMPARNSRPSSPAYPTTEMFAT
jgi:hypothetical protein